MSTVVTGVLAAGRSIDVGSFADLTTARVTDIDMEGGALVVTFDGTLTAAKKAACERRIAMTPSVEAAFASLEARVKAVESKAGITVTATLGGNA